jgi:acetyl-CoA synthetase
MFTAPTAVRMFMKYGPEHVTRSDLSTLRLIAVAGEPLNPEAMRWAHKWLLDDGKRGFVADNWWQTELGAPTIGTTIVKNAVPGAAGLAAAGRRGCRGGHQRGRRAARQGRACWLCAAPSRT